MRRRSRACSEDGYVIVLVLVLVIIGLGLAAAALTTTLASRSNANRDERSKRAQQAADAGIQTALYRANQTNMSALALSSGLSLSSVIRQLLVCPIPQVNANGSGQIAGLSFTYLANAQVGNPCPSNSGSGTGHPFQDAEPVGHHASFQLQYNPGITNVGDFVEFSPTIVSAGFDDNGLSGSSQRYVSQREQAILSPFIPWRTFEAQHNLSFDVPPAVNALGLKVAGTTTFNGTAAAGNNLTIDGQSLVNTFAATGISLSNGLTAPSALDSCNPPIETNIQVSLVLGNITKASPCTGLVNRSPVQISPSKPNCAPSTGVVPCSSLFSLSIYPNSTSVPDSIYCTSSCPALSFRPGDYVFCDFQYNGAVSLNPSSTQAVRIFIDNPTSSRCSGHGSHSSIGQPPGFRTSFGNFVATHGVGNVLGLTHPSQAQVYVAGDGTNDDTVAYSTGDTTLSSQDMFLYAPTSNVTVTGGQTCVLGTCVNTGTLSGAFIGYDVDASATAITEDLGLLNYPLSNTLGPFQVKQYVECTPAYPLPSPATSGC